MMTSTIRTSSCAVILPPPELHNSGAIWLNGLGANQHALLPMISALGLPDQHRYKFVFPHAPMQPANGFSRLVTRGKVRGAAPENPVTSGNFCQNGVMKLHAGLRYPEPLDHETPLSTCTPLTARLANGHDLVDVDTLSAVDGDVGSLVLALSLGSTASHQLRSLGYAVDAHDDAHQKVPGLGEVQAINDWLRQVLPSLRQTSIWRRAAARSKHVLLDRLMRPALCA